MEPGDDRDAGEGASLDRGDVAAFLAAVTYGDTDAVQRMLQRAPLLARSRDAVSMRCRRARGRVSLAARGAPNSSPTAPTSQRPPPTTHPAAQHGVTALMRAAAGGHRAVVNALLTGAKPARPKAHDPATGRTALHFAACADHAAVARALLLLGADPRARCRAGRTPLDECAEHGSDGVRRQILAQVPHAAPPPAPAPPVAAEAAAAAAVAASATSLTVAWDDAQARVAVAAAAVARTAGTAPPFPPVWKLQVAEAAGGDACCDCDSGAAEVDAPAGAAPVCCRACHHHRRRRRWVTVRVATLASVATVHGLLPGRAYVFRLAVANEFGWSAPSPPSAPLVSRAHGSGGGGSGGRSSVGTSERCDGGGGSDDLFSWRAREGARIGELLLRQQQRRQPQPQQPQTQQSRPAGGAAAPAAAERRPVTPPTTTTTTTPAPFVPPRIRVDDDGARADAVLPSSPTAAPQQAGRGDAAGSLPCRDGAGTSGGTAQRTGTHARTPGSSPAAATPPPVPTPRSPKPVALPRSASARDVTTSVAAAKKAAAAAAAATSGDGGADTQPPLGDGGRRTTGVLFWGASAPRP
jgi:uncharacterized membrane protein YgcG